MDGYLVESPELKEVRKLMRKGETKRCKSIMKELLSNENRFNRLIQIDQCFITRFLGEEFKADHKFKEALRLHKLYCGLSTLLNYVFFESMMYSKFRSIERIAN